MAETEPGSPVSGPKPEPPHVFRPCLHKLHQSPQY